MKMEPVKSNRINSNRVDSNRVNTNGVNSTKNAEIGGQNIDNKENIGGKNNNQLIEDDNKDDEPILPPWLMDATEMSIIYTTRISLQCQFSRYMVYIHESCETTAWHTWQSSIMWWFNIL